MSTQEIVGKLLSLVTRTALWLAVRAKLAIQSLRSTNPADLYFGCAREWRYPSYLVPALRIAGFSKIEVPITDARAMLRIDGIWNCLWHVRLLPSGEPIKAPVAIDRNPERLRGTPRLRVPIDCFSAVARQAASSSAPPHCSPRNPPPPGAARWIRNIPTINRHGGSNLRCCSSPKRGLSSL